MEVDIQATAGYKENDDDCTRRILDGVDKYGARSQSESCILRVHEELRKVNEKAYLPEVVAIGPYHLREGSLKWMEKQKFRYLYLLLGRSQVPLYKYVEVVSDLNPKLLEYYDDPIDTGRLLEMVVLDGCFIVELVRKFSMPELREENDPIFKMYWVFSSLQRDLVLFENQIPFKVLCRLFDLIEIPNRYDRLIYLVFRFFSNLFPGQVYGQRINQISAPNIKHLLELVHEMWLPPFGMLPSPPPRPLGRIPDSPRRIGRRRFHSATDLQENGVRFKRLEKANQFNIKFKNGVLWIPPLTVEERTESFLRNLMAFEQYSTNDDTQNSVTAYVKFLDFLIDSPEDVELLTKYGVIDNWLSDTREVHRMFKKINSFITIHSAAYPFAHLYDSVNAYCSKSVVGKIARIRRSLFRGSLAVIWVTAVLTLLLSVVIVTTTQTVYTARFPK
nr:UPF0481 protein At3g47200-like [Ipomoea batatas]GME05442.1 UPF0481 protein At3g47200-like [Ipomoea batatas]